MKYTNCYFMLFVFIIANSIQANAQDDDYSPYDLLSSYYENDFKPFKKGNWYTGLSFSLTDKQRTNTQGLLQNVIDGDDLEYNINLKGGYYTGNYAMLGLNLDYYQTSFKGSIYREPDTIQSNSIVRGFGITPNIRSSVPLTPNERLSFYTTVGLSFGMETSNNRNIKNEDEINKRYATQYNFGIGISPGITFFAMENFAFEVQLNVLGYNLKVTETITNGTDVSRDVRQNVNFNIDILSLDLGLAYYFGGAKH